MGGGGSRHQDPEEIKWQKEVFYDLYADGKFQFNGDETIKVNKAVLAAKSEKFHEMFKESRENSIRIQDYDMETFKLFLDSLIGFHECSAVDVLLIFPIAWKYETKSFVKDCIGNLKPVDLNENVCSALNLGLICQCDELVQVILNFLRDGKLFYKLLEDEKLHKLLEPESMVKLLENVKIDSYLSKNILKWGKNHLEKDKKYDNDLKALFKDYKMIDKLTLSCFETSDSAFKICQSKTGKDFFTSDDFFAHVSKFNFVEGKSKWIKVKKGDKIKEKIIVKDVVNIEKHEVELVISKNPVVFYDHPKEDSEMMICTTLTYSYDGLKRNAKNEEIFPETMKTIYSDEKKEFGVKIEGLANAVKDVELEIVFHFLFDCRILKMTSKKLSPKEKDNLFFVNSVEIIRKKK